MNTKSSTTLKPDLDYLWKYCTLNRDVDSSFIQKKIKDNYQCYLDVQKETGVPWGFIVALHYRESGCDFNKCLHNGEPFGKIFTKVPIGKGPFNNWEEAAIDAIKSRNINVNKMTKTTDWLLAAERYNGLGYRAVGIYSPYLWSGTNWYKKGKFKFDGVFDSELVDKQTGIVPILKKLWE